MDDTILDTLMDSIHHDFQINPMLERKLRKVCVFTHAMADIVVLSKIFQGEALEKSRKASD